MREYELMFVLAPDLQEDGVTTATERVTSLITNRGGEITKVDTWGRRRMAYPIRRHPDGFYTVLRFRLEPTMADELERNLRLNEQIMRHLIVHAVDVPPSRTIRRVNLPPAAQAAPAAPVAPAAPAAQAAPVAPAGPAASAVQASPAAQEVPAAQEAPVAPEQRGDENGPLQGNVDR